ncbi:MAG: hypothetical protein B6I19_05310, partial [Bacteroidetes bacterium 4572_114]
MLLALNAQSQSMDWVLLSTDSSNGGCTSNTDCNTDILCYGLQYTPNVTGVLTSYTTGFFTTCTTSGNPVTSNSSCSMTDNSDAYDACAGYGLVLFNSSGNSGNPTNNSVTAGVPVIIHQVCFTVPSGESITITEDDITDLTTNVDLSGGGSTTEFPSYSDFTIINNNVCQGPTATDNESLNNSQGPVSQQVVTEDDGYGIDSDPNNDIDITSVDIDQGTAGQQTTLVVSGEGTWSADNAGNVTFTPETGYTDDPTPITYTIRDLTNLESNAATITVKYKRADLSVTKDDGSTQYTAGTTVTYTVTVTNNGPSDAV